MGNNKSRRLTSVKRGTGQLRIGINKEKRTAQLDLSGNDNETRPDGKINCFRNDASVLFYIANSYWNATKTLEEKIRNCFDADKDCSDLITQLVIPYFFEFRHFVELSLKALFMNATGEQAENTHELDKLFNTTKEAILNLKPDVRQGIFTISNEQYETAMVEIKNT